MSEPCVAPVVPLSPPSMQVTVTERRNLPPAVARLLCAATPEEREEAWAAFVQSHSRLVFHAAHTFGGGHDRTMDAYAFILERLRGDDFRRIRAFAADGRSLFSTWLVVVSRRLCMDHHRQRYGRPRPAEKTAADEGRHARRRLADLVADRSGIEQVVDTEGVDPERYLREADLSRALRECVQRLEPADQLLLRLRFDDGLSAKEIAQLIPFPSPFHVYRRVQRLLDNLRKMLEEHGISDSTP